MALISDNTDETVALLRQIAANTGALGDELDDLETGSANSQSGRGQRIINPGRYFEFETDDLDDANDDGTITLEPGDRAAIVEADMGDTVMLHGVGATDEAGVTYQVRLDSQFVGRSTNSPLGTINNPWMYPEKVGGSLPAERSVAYVAMLDPSASASVDVAGRLICEVVG